MSEKAITPTEICAAAGCNASTLRAWHNRSGLLPRSNPGKMRRYTLADLLAVRVMVILTQRGMAAGVAVPTVHLMLRELQAAASGFPSTIAIGGVGPDGTLAVERIDPNSDAASALAFDSELIEVLNLNLITISMVFAIRRLRGSEVLVVNGGVN